MGGPLGVGDDVVWVMVMLVEEGVWRFVVGMRVWLLVLAEAWSD